MGNRFDEIAKSVASAVTRREALRRFGGGIAGAMLAAFGVKKASADHLPGGFCVNFCAGLGIAPSDSDAMFRCVRNCGLCTNRGGRPCGADACCFGNDFCCGDGRQRVCCDPRAECCGGNCIVCPEGLILDPATCECVEPCCRGPGFVCSNGGIEQCNDIGFGCFCFSRLDGSGECGENDFCSNLAGCSSDADCPAGTFCSPNTCCGNPVCLAFCDCDINGIATRTKKNVLPTGNGLTAAG